MGLPFDRIDRHHACPVHWLYQPESNPYLRAYGETPIRDGWLCDCRGGHGASGNPFAWHRNRHVGGCLPFRRGVARHKIVDALFVGRNDDVRASEPVSGRQMAAAGNAGGAEWVAALWFVDRFSVLADSG